MHIQFSTRPTQDSATHIHTVWRDLKNDWGEDLLRHHDAKPYRADEL